MIRKGVRETGAGQTGKSGTSFIIDDSIGFPKF